MATQEEVDAAAERIRLGLLWDEQQRIFYCVPAAVDLMARGALDAAEKVRRRASASAHGLPSAQQCQPTAWTHPLVREDRPE